MSKSFFTRRNLTYLAQAAVVYSFYGLFKLMPPDMASATGGWIGRHILARTGMRKKVLRNLRMAMPELSEAQVERINADMWDNLGRVIAEYPHLEWLGRHRVTIIGQEYVDAVRASTSGSLMVSGHFANWEMLPVSVALQNLSPQLVYRHANNPYVDRLLSRARTPMGGKLARKGVQGARSVHGALRAGGVVGMLVDQKHNRGRAIPFFGRPAMTATAFAELTLKYQVPLLLGHIERTGGAHFRATLLPPMEIPTGLSDDAAIDDIMTRTNAQFESWIRANPAQWLWLHRRWSD